MTKLIWDQVGERLYETGIDRGVLYLVDGSAVPWNGLISITETEDDTTSPVYFDGTKYYDVQSIGDFSATLTAFTYPDEFLEYEGIIDLGTGVFVDGQVPKPFGLSYRTQIANSNVPGYKIHILYNLTALADPINYATITSSESPIPFSWVISGVPEAVSFYRPTAHVICDSRYLNTTLLTGLEDLLYGDIDTPGHLPSLLELVSFISFWDPKYIVPQTVTGLAQLVDGSGDLTLTNVDGLYSALPSTKLVPYGVDGFYSLLP